MHLLIPFASWSSPPCTAAQAALVLPHLEKLMQRLELAHTDGGSAHSLSPPHERALAQLCEIAAPDGCIAWAAHELAQSGRDPGADAWAWITPVHWEVSGTRIDLWDPRALDLPELESRALCAAMQPFFKEDGIALEYLNAQRWLARAEVFDGMASASLDRVVGREISAWMPSDPGLLRLQNEMQMLLYTHPVNDDRIARNLPTVNSFWISATGRLAQPGRGQPSAGLVVVDASREAALRHDWAAWSQAWRQVDGGECRALLERLDSGGEARLTLCGERNALTFTPVLGGVLRRLRHRFKSNSMHALLEQL